MRKFSIFCFTFLLYFSANAQIVINEILPPSKIEIQNRGDSIVDISSYWLCQFPTYQKIENLLPECEGSSMLLGPGETYTIRDFNGLSHIDGELGLYITDSFASETAIIDYVQWGSGRHRRASVAVSAGILANTNSFVPRFGPGQSLAYDGNGHRPKDWVVFDTPNLCMDNGLCVVNGGQVSLLNGLTHLIICVDDGEPDEFDVQLEGTVGTNSDWIITDETMTIIDFLPGPPFNFENTAPGTYLLWHMSYQDDLENGEKGFKVKDLLGCFDLSNPIMLIRKAGNACPTACGVAGGVLTTEDGQVERVVCSGDEQNDWLQPILLEKQGEQNAWVLTDQTMRILDIPNAVPINLEGVLVENCYLWNISFNGQLEGFEPGNSLLSVEGCFDLSNPIRIKKEFVQGGQLTTSSGILSFSFCANDGVSDSLAFLVSDTKGANEAWVVSDENSNIIALPDQPVFDFENLGMGTYTVRHLVYEDGLEGLAENNSLSGLLGCYAFSNPIEVTNSVVLGGKLTTKELMTEQSICVGDGFPGVFDLLITNALGPNFGWIITDQNEIILDPEAEAPFNLEDADPGTCLIWHISYADVIGLEKGNNIRTLEGCFELSNPVSITKVGVNGGVLTTSDGLSEQTVCISNQFIELLNVNLEEASGGNRRWVITDEQLTILGFPANPPFNFAGIESTTCLLWNVSYSDGLVGLEIGKNAAYLDGCYDWSNPLTIYKQEVAGGELSTSFGATDLDICIGGGQSNLFYVDVVGAKGDQISWLITNENGIILDLPAGPPFNFENSSGGVCQIWHLRYTGNLDGLQVGQSIDQFSGCFDLSNPITVNRSEVDGGILVDKNGQDEVFICENESNFLEVELGGAKGDQFTWVITTESYHIVDLPIGPIFDFGAYANGTYYLWHLSYAGDLIALQRGLNLLEVGGCYDLSNKITINKNFTSGGEISLADGADVIDLCIGDGIPDLFDVVVEGAVGRQFAWVISDQDQNIIALPEAFPYDFENTGAGVYLIWQIAFIDQIDGLFIGGNLEQLDGCYAISNSITVHKREVQGGVLTTSEGETQVSICDQEEVFETIDTRLVGNRGSNLAWIITDNNFDILAVPDGPPFDLSTFAAGDILLWSLSYEEGLLGLEKGASAFDLTGCFDLSNPIMVFKNSPEGGEITHSEGTEDLSICIGNGGLSPLDVSLTGQSGGNSIWLITDENHIIIDLPNHPPFDLEEIEENRFLIWHLSYNNPIVGVQEGASLENVEGCYDLSNSIAVTREVVNGGILTTSEGETEVSVCLGDGISEALEVDLAGVAGDNNRWILTDESLKVLAIPGAAPFDFEGSEPGVCLLWNLSYYDLDGLAIGQSINDLKGCFALSNAIRIIRQAPEECNPMCTVIGGVLKDVNGDTEQTICFGDIPQEPIELVIDEAEGAKAAWVVTNEDFLILSLPEAATLDLEDINENSLKIWHVSYEDPLIGLELGKSLDSIEGCFERSNSYSIVKSNLKGGELTALDNTTNVSICIGDGEIDLIDVNLEGALGEEQTWIVTDELGEILAFLTGPPFNFEESDLNGTHLWHLSHDSSVGGLDIGANINTLAGCFALSNALTIQYLSGNDCITDCFVEGGELTTLTGETELVLCSGDEDSDTFDVNLEGTEGGSFAWLMTDEQGQILETLSGPPFDLKELDSGIYLLWYLNYQEGLLGLEIGELLADLVGCYDLSNAIRIINDTVDGGVIATPSGGDRYVTCASDGVTDLLNLTLSGAKGSNAAWIITDESLRITSLPAGPPFQFTDIGSATSYIWHIRYEDAIEGLEIEGKVTDIKGCFDASNPVVVERARVDGGELRTSDDETEVSVCIGDLKVENIHVDLQAVNGSQSAWVITDEDFIILDLPDDTPFNLENLEGDEFLIWHLAYEEGIAELEIGQHAAGISGCFDWSNAITVRHDRVDGGIISMENGATEVEYCSQNGSNTDLEVDLQGAEGKGFSWVITDENGIIIDLPDSSLFQLGELNEENCLIWHLSYGEQLEGLEIGNDIDDLSGCFSWSNAISVKKSKVLGGNLSLLNDNTNLVCLSGSTEVGVELTIGGATGENMAWVITDADDIIQRLPQSLPVSFENLESGTYRIWHLSYVNEISGLRVGRSAGDITGCFAWSNAILVEKNLLSGGVIETKSSETSIVICSNEDLPDNLEINLVENIGPSANWVITDINGQILDLPLSPPFDFRSLQEAEFYIWHLSYLEGIQGLNIGGNINTLTGCYDRSNAIEVKRNTIAGGLLTTQEGENSVSFCGKEPNFPSIQVNLIEAQGTNFAWVLSDDQGRILDLPPNPPFSLGDNQFGTFFIYSLSYEEGLLGLGIGNQMENLEGCFGLSNPIQITIDEVEGGNISTIDGETETIICVGDGQSDVLQMALTNSKGKNKIWCLTDEIGTIINLSANSTFNLDDGVPGKCFVLHISYAEDQLGLDLGDNINDLTGCFDFSNILTINKIPSEDCSTECIVAGGQLTLANGQTQLTICADDGVPDPFNVTLEDEIGKNSAWVITDEDNNILSLPPSPPFDLEGAGEGIGIIWHLSFDDNLQGLEVFNNITSLSGCFDLSNPITVIRTIEEDCITECVVQGGDLITIGGTTEDVACIGDGEPDDILTILQNNVGLNSAWIITNEELMIIDLPTGPPFDFEGTGLGISLIWHMSYSGVIDGVARGNSITAISGCFDLSNPVTITKQAGSICDNTCEVNGGSITSSDNAIEVSLCVDDESSDAIMPVLTGAIGANSNWVVTNENSIITDILEIDSQVEFENSSEGTCFIWHISYEGTITGLTEGSNLNELIGCFDLSNPITVIKNTGEGCEPTCFVDGGALTTIDGKLEKTICSGDGKSDEIGVLLDGNDGPESSWVLTTADYTIFDLTLQPPFEMEGLDAGTCMIWHLSYEAGLQGLEVGENANALEGCFDLSNPITIIKQSVEDCEDDLNQGVDLELDISGPDNYTIFETFDYTLSVTNNGTEKASSFVILAELPEGTAYVNHTATKGSYGTFFNRWEVNSLESGEQATLEISIFPLIEGTPIESFVEIVEMTDNDVDSAPGNGTAPTPFEDDEAYLKVESLETSNLGGMFSDLELSLEVLDSSFNLFEDVVLTLKIENKGPEQATNLVISIPIPEQFAYSDSKSSIGAYGPYFQNWELDQLNSGEIAVLNLKLFPLLEESIAFYGQVIAVDQLDADSAPNNGNGIDTLEDDEVSIVFHPKSVDRINTRMKIGPTNEQFVEVFPNPASDYLNIWTNADADHFTHIRLFSNNGVLAKVINVQLIKGNNKTVVPVEELLEGIYYVEVEGKVYPVLIRKN